MRAVSRLAVVSWGFLKNRLVSAAFSPAVLNEMRHYVPAQGLSQSASGLTLGPAPSLLWLQSHSGRAVCRPLCHLLFFFFFFFYKHLLLQRGGAAAPTALWAPSPECEVRVPRPCTFGPLEQPD